MIGDAMKRRVLSQLLESEGIDKMTWILAAAENELLETAVRLEEAQDLDHIRGEDLPSIGARQDALKSLLGALANGDMETVFVEDIAPSLLDTTDGIDEYVGMDADEWSDQIERWADAYRDAAPESSDRELAAHHVRSKWGTDLATFEDRVVEFDAGAEAERLFAGNLRAVRETMDRAADAAGGE